MAATDQHYRSQKALHVVFALSSIAMLVSIVWMFAQDQFREWKVEQRIFRDVEEEMAKRTLLASAPGEAQMQEVVAAEAEVASARKARDEAKRKAEAALGGVITDKIKSETRYQAVKADFDSRVSFYNIEVEKNGADSAAAGALKAEIDDLKQRLDDALATVQENQRKVQEAERQQNLPELEKNLKAAEDKLKKQTADFDRFLKLVAQKHWKTFSDNFRALPVLDGFASPTKIQQYTLDDLPIDYSFKYVTRFDRCTTCHQGLEKPAYDKESLAQLTQEPGEELTAQFRSASKLIEDRRKAGATDLPRPDQIKPKKLADDKLTPGRVNEFCAHPRLDLFVDANSPHPAEKFGCTSCHAGQGSSTSFFQASHAPNDTRQAEHWKETYGWGNNHFWDFPMTPQRFVESACVKCHYQITDLIRDGSRAEAPKLVKGYNLVRELGCFGCHEIAGIKSGRRVGPDLRLESDPPLESLSPVERVRATADPLNPPGTMRKVGPSLYRLAEKTHEDWVARWIKEPRGFRPDTKMPHFYLQPNNDPHGMLQGTGQEKFPDAEVRAIAHYLMAKSRDHLKAIGERHKDAPAAQNKDEEIIKVLVAKAKLDDKEKRELEAAKLRMELRSAPLPLAASVQLPPVPADDAGKRQQLDRGRQLFTEKGCLACHQHEGTATDGKTADGKPIPALVTDAQFGPNLSRLTAKLGTKAGDQESARRWLVQWLLKPTLHSPRTLMPSVFHAVDGAEALANVNDIAAWLLSQQTTGWAPVEVAPADLETLKTMARTHLERVLPKREAREVLEKGFTEERAQLLAPDADERELGVGPLDDDKLKTYLGRKAITNLGCYACHSIPGFQNAKPIGTPLNDWGKKDIDRLAFEDGEAFVKEHFQIVPLRDDPKDKDKAADDWIRAARVGAKGPYESFYAEMLGHHGRKREGFLHLKLQEPRSYDYNRIRNWEERLRMPQFKFARPQRRPGEDDAAFRTRASKEEAEAREAVMTFILGLVAENVPAKFVHNPAPDRQAVVKGRQVLDKFNCGGCHVVRPGAVDFKAGPDLLKQLQTYEAAAKKPHLTFPGHNAWTGTLPAKDRLRAHFLTRTTDEDDAGKKLDVLGLGLAMRFLDADGAAHDIPASGAIGVPPEAVTARADRFGGQFADLLVNYLAGKDPEKYGGAKKNADAPSAAPPSLLHEGEKVQPVWLYQFLLNPTPLRPLTVLRMPKFNMSEDDAQALVNYFTAVDKTSNPGVGLNYPYLSVPERHDSYLREQTAKYVARLKAAGKYAERVKELQPFWDQLAKTEVADAEARVKAAEVRLKEAKTDDDKKLAETGRKEAEADLKRLQVRKGTEELEQRWAEREAYVADAYRLVANGNLCLTCHQVGGIRPKGEQGPKLEMAHERLRPEYVFRYVADPLKFLPYTVMPVNFPLDKTEHQEAFVGSPEDQIRAAKDFLMLYPQVADWKILQARPVIGMGGTVK